MGLKPEKAYIGERNSITGVTFALIRFLKYQNQVKIKLT
jgi:hypothetical protein